MVIETQDIDKKSAKEYSSAALRAFFNIAEKWRLSVRESCVLLGCSQATYHKWKKNPHVALDRDKLERLSNLLGIYKNLQILLPDKESANAWVKKPNFSPLFNGQSALDRMLSGQVVDLHEVRNYLEGERGGW